MIIAPIEASYLVARIAGAEVEGKTNAMLLKKTRKS
jgi:hypothetical protein